MLLFLLYFLCSLPFLQAPTAADTPTDGEAGLTTFPAAPLAGSNAWRAVRGACVMGESVDVGIPGIPF